MIMNDTTAQLDSIFHPRSVAIIGASSREGSFGNLFLQGFIRMGFENIYPVHPRERELLGLKAYKSVKDVPCEVDLAILLIPPGEALRIVQECADKRVKGIVLFTAGFGEKGEEGKKIEQEMAQIVREAGTRLIGPNTNGLYVPSSKLLTLPGSLTAGGLTTESGGVSVFAQSGSFNDYTSQVLVSKNIRFNKVVSCGNESDLNSIDFLEYFGSDAETEIIGGYIEGIEDGRRFYELAKNISKQKPIIIWKGGLTETGAKAALAHTGALSGSKQVWETMVKQAGIINVNSFEEFTDCLLAFSWLPLPKGRKVGIISGMGGTNVGTADNCTMMGLEIAEFSEQTSKRLNEILPPVGTAANNPVDVGVGMLMAPQLYGETIKLLAEDDSVDMLICITAPDCPLSVKSIADAAKEINKPLVACLFEIGGLVEDQLKFLLENHIPAYSEPKRAALALFKMFCYADYVSGNTLNDEDANSKQGITENQIIQDALEQGRLALTEIESKEVLSEAGINVVEARLAASERDAITYGKEMGFPLVLKICSSDIIHKSDFGGVRVGLNNEDDIKRAYKEIIASATQKYPEAKIEGVSLQKMASPGIEVIIGAHRDAQFGPVLMFGLGGMLVEVLKDVSFRLIPIVRKGAVQMIEEIKGYSLLKGYRGREPVDISTLEEYILRVSDFMENNPRIKELELNPIFAYHDGAIAVDARIVLEGKKRVQP
jgi:acyl-CoA synthetase (NDP forming)